jgi:putative transposase
MGHPGTPISHLGAPHEVWSADFTGHFKTGDGRDGYPLTITDGYSRLLLSCQARSSTRVAEATAVFTRVCKAFGLPQRIRPDHGVPFATHTLARRSQWSARWVRLGLVPACIAPGKPPQHGRHERMHRTLNADTTRPPGANLRAPQRKFTHFRAAFNHERPHEALDRHTPAACDAPSPREMPNTRPPLASPDRVEVRYVSANGGIRWNHPWGNVSTTCAGEYVGLEEIADGVWNVSCGSLKRGRLLERYRRIEDADGRLKRHR